VGYHQGPIFPNRSGLPAGSKGDTSCREGCLFNLAVGIGQGDTVILYHHWLPSLRDLHSDLAVIAVIFCRNDGVAPG
jgi:hypothetical protein